MSSRNSCHTSAVIASGRANGWHTMGGAIQRERLVGEVVEPGTDQRGGKGGLAQAAAPWHDKQATRACHHARVDAE